MKKIGSILGAVFILGLFTFLANIGFSEIAGGESSPTSIIKGIDAKRGFLEKVVLECKNKNKIDYYGMIDVCIVTSVATIVLCWLLLYKGFNKLIVFRNKRARPLNWWIIGAFPIIIINFASPICWWLLYFADCNLSNGRPCQDIPSLDWLYSILFSGFSFVVFCLLSLPIIVENLAGHNYKSVSLPRCFGFGQQK